MIEFCDELPDRDQFWELFQTTGWNEEYRLAPDDFMKVLRSSWYMLSVYDGNRLVAFGRLASDGVMHAMIYEMIVLPEYQGQGIGGQILEHLIQKCREAGIHDIQLFCARGKRGFYEKYGFVARPDEGPGMQYRHQ